MKLLSLLWLLCCVKTAISQTEVFSSGSNDTAQLKPWLPSLESPKENLLVKMGKEGESISSEDGNVEIFFPAGCLSKKTNINIQTVQNRMQNRSGPRL